MTEQALWSVFVAASLTNNFVLAYFLGICPFLGVSSKVDISARMGAAVVFVILIASVCAYGINVLLAAIGAEHLRLISCIAVISSTVQIVEMIVKKLSPLLFREFGFFLPLITTNYAILYVALFQTNKGYDFLQCLVYALGAGSGFTLALVLIAGLREKLDLASVPGVVRGANLTLLLAGILSICFMGFAGLG